MSLRRLFGPAGPSGLGDAVAGCSPARSTGMQGAARRQGLVFLAPAVGALGLVLLGPIAYSLQVSLYNWSLVLPGSDREFVGLANYTVVMASPEFRKAVLVTLMYALAALCIQLPLGMLLAILLNQSFFARPFFRSVMMIPMVVTPSVLGIFWKLFYEEEGGLFNYLLASIGLPKIAWLGLDYALVSTILMDAWQMTPFFMLILLAGLQSCDQEQIEAAKIDGAGPLQVFGYLTLPHLVPYILIACSFRLIGALGDFDKIYLLTAGGPGDATTTMSVFAYKTGFSAFEISRTAAFAWLYLGVVFAVSAPLIFYLNRVAFRDA